MASFLDSGDLRVFAYAIAAVACLLAGWRERRSPELQALDLWPAFWTLCAVLLATMAIARATDLAEALTDLARSSARSSGWYAARRPLQGAVVGGLSLFWVASVGTAIWRVPERRRRYLPTAIAVFSLICFAGVRLISFHYADTVLYRYPIAGVHIASIIELSLNGYAALAAGWRAWLPSRRLGRAPD